MTADKPLEMAPYVEKLRQLETHVPDRPADTYSFARLLADRLERSPGLYPLGFNTATKLLLK